MSLKLPFEMMTHLKDMKNEMREGEMQNLKKTTVRKFELRKLMTRKGTRVLMFGSEQ